MATQRNQRTRKSATAASAWKKDSQGVPLEVPSGHTALVRPVGMQVFMQRGMIPNVLMPIVQEGIKGKQVDPTEIMEGVDMDAINDMMKLMDDVVVFTVVDPKVWPVPKWTEKEAEEELCHPTDVGQAKPTEDRDPDRLYVDEVEDDDKQFIFQFVVGGTRDVESFRKEQADALANVRTGEDVGDDS